MPLRLNILCLLFLVVGLCCFRYGLPRRLDRNVQQTAKNYRAPAPVLVDHRHLRMPQKSFHDIAASSGTLLAHKRKRSSHHQLYYFDKLNGDDIARKRSGFDDLGGGLVPDNKRSGFDDLGGGLVPDNKRSGFDDLGGGLVPDNKRSGFDDLGGGLVPDNKRSGFDDLGGGLVPDNKRSGFDDFDMNGNDFSGEISKLYGKRFFKG